MDILEKMKNLFGSKKEEIKISLTGNLFNIIKNSGITQKNLEKLTKNGNSDENIKKELKNILFFKKDKEEIPQKVSEKVLYLNTTDIITAFQVAKACQFKKIIVPNNLEIDRKKINQYIYETKISLEFQDDNSQVQNFQVQEGLVLTNSPQNNSNTQVLVNNVLNNVLNDNKVLCFLKIKEDNFGALLNIAMENKDKILGFSSSDSVLDSRLFGINSLVHNILKIQKSKKKASISEMSLMAKFQSSNPDVNFNEINFSLEKVEELSKTNALASFGVKITPDMIKMLKKQKGIINSMTEKEKLNPSLFSNQERIKRIAIGSKSTIEEVQKLISLIDMIKKGGMANMMNPSALLGKK